MPKFTIITPTFDNGPTLAYAIDTVKRQTFIDYEHVIVGDGAVDSAREIARAYAAEDDRVRFIDNPKGPENGQLHRDAAIRATSGELICYLSDDELWFGDHLETLSELIGDADFAHTMTVCAMADGEFGLFYGDFSNPAYRSELISGHCPIVPSTVAHTRSSYLRLPQGWTAAAPGMAADTTLWLQFIDLPGVRFQGSGMVTCLRMPAKDPTREPGEAARLRQMSRWRDVLADTDRVASFRRQMLDLLYRHAADRQAESVHFQTLAKELAAAHLSG